MHCKNWKTILPLAITFLVGVCFADIVAENQLHNEVENIRIENIATNLIPKIQLTPKAEFEDNSDPKLILLNKRLKELSEYSCDTPVIDDSVSIYRIRNGIEIEYLSFQISLIKLRKDKLNYNKERQREIELVIRRMESNLGDFESKLRKINKRIKRFETDIHSGKIDRNNDNNYSKYIIENCIQK